MSAIICSAPSRLFCAAGESFVNQPLEFYLWVCLENLGKSNNQQTRKKQETQDVSPLTFPLEPSQPTHDHGRARNGRRRDENNCLIQNGQRYMFSSANNARCDYSEPSPPKPPHLPHARPTHPLNHTNPNAKLKPAV